MGSFNGPTPANTMTEAKSGYGYAECSRCGFRTRVSDKMTPESNPELYSRSSDQVLLHNCDPEEYNWDKSKRERSKQRLSLLTALAEIQRWHGVIEKCLPFFSPSTRDEATTIATEGSAYAGKQDELLTTMIDSEPGGFV